MLITNNMPLIFFILFASIILYFLFLFTYKNFNDNIQNINKYITFPLSILAIISSVISIYFVYIESLNPKLVPEIKFLEIEINENSNNDSRTNNEIKELGGLYFLIIKNVGNEDAIMITISGFLVDHETKEKVTSLQYNPTGIGINQIHKEIFYDLDSNQIYNGLINITCNNCDIVTRWIFQINTSDQKITLNETNLGTGLWRKNP